MTRKLSYALLGAAVVAIAALWLGYLPTRKQPQPPVMLKEIQALSELVTVKYVMEKVVTHEIAKTFGKDKVLLIAHGVVKAGIDLDKMKPEDLRVAGKSISIHLPRPEVTDSHLDEKQTFVYDRSTGLLVRPDKDLETQARRIALAAILGAAQAGGIHKEADMRAREAISRFSRLAGFEVVEFF
jgi:hypothetical protein